MPTALTINPAPSRFEILRMLHQEEEMITKCPSLMPLEVCTRKSPHALPHASHVRGFRRSTVAAPSASQVQALPGGEHAGHKLLSYSENPVQGSRLSFVSPLFKLPTMGPRSQNLGALTGIWPQTGQFSIACGALGYLTILLVYVQDHRLQCE